MLPLSLLTQVISAIRTCSNSQFVRCLGALCQGPYLFLIIVITLLMSPLPILSDGASLDRWGTVLELRSHWSTLFLVFSFAAVLRFVIVVLGKRKKRVSGSGGNLEGSSMDHNGFFVKRRKDSSQNEELDLSKNMQKCIVTDLKEKNSSRVQSHDKARRVSPEQSQNDYLESLKQETLEPFRLPIYPWIAPPQRLPGPYDAPYYPLPLPTIAIQETAGDDTKPSISETTRDRPEELETITYSHRISTENSIKTELVRESVVTVSTKGWRRTQWTVNAG